MLCKLYIKDYALIDELTIELGAGLNTMTGETGAGKSIIIGALSLLLGERAKVDIIRQGASIAVVEGFFNIPMHINLQKFSEYFDITDHDLLLRREVHINGRSRCFINDSPISNSILSQLGDLLIDLHGQHEHQTLLKVDRHLDYLDNFGVDKLLRENVKTSFKKFQSLNTELLSLQDRETILKEKRELLEFQVHEINTIDPQEGEEEALETEEKLLQNSEKIFQAAKTLSDLLYDGEGAVTEKLAAGERILTGLINVDKPFEKWLKTCEEARISVEEIITNFQVYLNKIEFNPQKLEEIRERLGQFSRLKKKYGGDMAQVFIFYNEARRELQKIETMDAEIKKVVDELEIEKNSLTQLVQELSEKRKNVAIDMEKKVLSALEELGLKNGKFQIIMQIKKNPEGPIRIDNQCFSVTAKGMDRAEFFISLNPGQDPKPLAKIASGGEISRIMLALKTVLAEADEVPVMVFDEIDTGISGKIARVVGKNLKDVSEKHQIVCITHLPQIASMGHTHLCVQKEIKDNQSRTIVKTLTNQERVFEIAKLLGGEEVTDSTLQSARELLMVQKN